MTAPPSPLFSSPDDARQFLTERLKLWGLWVIALALMVTLGGWLLLVAAVLVLVNLGSVARPLHARAVDLVPEDSQVGNAFETMIGRGTERDRLARKLMYGAEPLEEALTLTGGSRAWLLAHWAVIALTVAAFALVFLGGWFA